MFKENIFLCLLDSGRKKEENDHSKKKSKIPEKTEPPNIQFNEETKTSIKDKFLVSMPEDFYDFMKFLIDFNSLDPEKVIRAYNLR